MAAMLRRFTPSPPRKIRQRAFKSWNSVAQQSQSSVALIAEPAPELIGLVIVIGMQSLDAGESAAYLALFGSKRHGTRESAIAPLRCVSFSRLPGLSSRLSLAL